MKKTFSTLLISSILLSSTAFASTQSLSEIMSNYKDEVITLGAESATINSTRAIIESKISDAEMRDYLASELSPRDFKKLENSLNKGINISEVTNLVMSTSNGANFKGRSCGGGAIAINVISGLVALASGITSLVLHVNANTDRATAQGLREKQTYDSNFKDTSILNLQLEITALKNEGVASTSYFITDRNAQIARLQLEIAQGKTAMDTLNAKNLVDAANLDRGADSEDKGAITAAIVTGVSLTSLGLNAFSCKDYRN